MSRDRLAPRKLAFLGMLYFVEGLPFGFQAKALPVYLREAGVSLTGIGLLGLLALPWLLKPLWAPWIEAHYVPRVGRRRTWILAMQAALAAATLTAAWIPPDSSLTALLVMILVMNLFAATLDIAVDGLAVDLLSDAELGIGNAGQVVGYKLGMLTGGGLLVWASASIGWAGLFGAIAALTATGFVVALGWRERPADARADTGVLRPVEVLRDLWRALRASDGRWVLAAVATYKLGESMADAMFKPFLVDSGFDAPQIGLWVGTYGTVFSIAGSAVGGLMASRLPVPRALGITAAARCLPLAAQTVVAIVGATHANVIAVTCAEHFFGGALTTAMFAFMMQRVNRRIGATHFTALAAIEVLGKSPSAWLSGPIAEALGYAAVFGIGTALSVLFLGVLGAVARRPEPV